MGYYLLFPGRWLLAPSSPKWKAIREAVSLVFKASPCVPNPIPCGVQDSHIERMRRKHLSQPPPTLLCSLSLTHQPRHSKTCHLKVVLKLLWEYWALWRSEEPGKDANLGWAVLYVSLFSLWFWTQECWGNLRTKTRTRTREALQQAYIVTQSSKLCLTCPEFSIDVKSSNQTIVL